MLKKKGKIVVPPPPDESFLSQNPHNTTPYWLQLAARKTGKWSLLFPVAKQLLKTGFLILRRSGEWVLEQAVGLVYPRATSEGERRWSSVWHRGEGVGVECHPCGS